MKYFDFKDTREVDWVSGAFMLGRKSTFEQIGGFDKDFFMYCEDIEICWRLNKEGYKVLFSDKARIIHSVGHTVHNKSIVKAKMLVESSGILWNKHYDFRTVKKLFVILCIGSMIRKIVWQVLALARISKSDNMGAYYKAIISESLNYLKDGNKA